MEGGKLCIGWLSPRGVIILALWKNPTVTGHAAMVAITFTEKSVSVGGKRLMTVYVFLV
jgi:hypothetical protein